jgi:hypothetical protein
MNPQSQIVVNTTYGQVPLDELVKAYEQKKKSNDAKLEWYKTEEGKQYNRKKAKEYYERNKEKVLAKAAERYKADPEKHLNRIREYQAKKKEEQGQNNM